MDSAADGEQVQAPPVVEVPSDFKMPSLEEVLDALNHLEGISEDEKEKLRKNLIDNHQEFSGTASEVTKQLSPDSWQLITLLLLLSIVALIFGKAQNVRSFVSFNSNTYKIEVDKKYFFDIVFLLNKMN